jgi:hypothetical protein
MRPEPPIFQCLSLPQSNWDPASVGGLRGSEKFALDYFFRIFVIVKTPPIWAARGQGLVPVIPKPEHALVSIESAPSTEKIPLCRKDLPLRPKMQCYVSSRAF